MPSGERVRGPEAVRSTKRLALMPAGFSPTPWGTGGLPDSVHPLTYAPPQRRVEFLPQPSRALENEDESLSI